MRLSSITLICPLPVQNCLKTFTITRAYSSSENILNLFRSFYTGNFFVHVPQREIDFCFE